MSSLITFESARMNYVKYRRRNIFNSVSSVFCPEIHLKIKNIIQNMILFYLFIQTFHNNYHSKIAEQVARYPVLCLSNIFICFS